MSSTTHNVTPSLVDDPRHNLEKWAESVETIARSMCAMHDVTGALILVMSDTKWTSMPVNFINPIDVAAGQPAVYRNRPAYAMPADHAGNIPLRLRSTSTAWRQRGTTTSALPAAPSPPFCWQALVKPMRTLSTPPFQTSRQIVDIMLAKRARSSDR